MKSTKDLRIIGVPWHVAHQYELAKLFKEYNLIMNHYREWGDVSRPMPANMKMVLEIKPGEYDMGILHVDQQVCDPNIGKGKLFREMKELFEAIKLPYVIINHMTPFDDKLETPELIAKMRELVGDTPMVTNSKTAALQWGWGQPIIHGMDIDEWWDLPKEPRVVTSLSTGGMATAYRRELLLMTIELLKEKGLNLVWIQADHKCNSFEEYREFIGRSAIYFNPTWQSPMPRSRTEAMLSGACIVSTKHHDWSDYIKDGVNGFLIPDNPRAAANLLTELLTTGYKKALEVGQRGKQTARENFNIDRWGKDWEKFLVTKGFIK